MATPKMCVVISPPHGYLIIRVAAPIPMATPVYVLPPPTPMATPLCVLPLQLPMATLFYAANYDLLVERGEDDGQEDVIGGKAKSNAQKRKAAQNKKAELHDQKIASLYAQDSPNIVGHGETSDQDTQVPDYHNSTDIVTVDQTGIRFSDNQSTRLPDDQNATEDSCHFIYDHPKSPIYITPLQSVIPNSDSQVDNGKDQTIPTNAEPPDPIIKLIETFGPSSQMQKVLDEEGLSPIDFEEVVRLAEEKYIQTNSDQDRSFLHALNAEYIRYLKLEESILKQKAQLQLFKEGDANTSYFHALMRGRRRKLFIPKVRDDNGN
ncbi:hypothetical protein H5410_046259 [Solanum commersonii]|uniref:Uncharacterized protein n=1 Tax=Solanum commersonii TaxID=4109 RepID=A0A9J5XBT0_SOLCO|nr:hypothetical protein H5410_046259 [Solanum commersonii]